MAMNYEIKGSKLIITVDVGEKEIAAAPMSKSGKNKLVATTGSFLRVNDKISFGLNVIAKE